MGRSVAALLVMLVTFGALAVLFIALDGATGVHPQNPLFAARARQHAPGRATTSRAVSISLSSSLPAPSATAGAADSASRTATAIVEARMNGRSPVTTAVTPVPTADTLATAVAPRAATPTGTAAAATATTTAMSGTATTTATSATVTETVSTTETITTTETVTPSGAVTPTGILSVTGTVTGSADTPPHYGALLNYANNTAFTPAFMQALDEQIIALTNAQRTTHGLAPLTESGQLDIIAASRGQDQIQRQYFDHYDPTGPVDANGRHAAAVVELLTRDGVPYTEVGENLIDNIGEPLDTTTPRGLVDSWMRHREHRDNILHGGYMTIGVGMAARNESDGLHVVFTQVFVR